MYSILMQKQNSSKKINYYLYIFLIVLLVYLFYFFIQHISFSREHMTNISGIVEKGRGVAKEYGYKTANITIDQELQCGVYNGESQYGKTTIMSNGSKHVQCHIHDFNENIYGKKLDIKNIKKLHTRYKSDKDHCDLAKNILKELYK